MMRSWRSGRCKGTRQGRRALCCAMTVRLPSASAVARFLLGLALLVGLDSLGGWLVRVAHAPVPGSVVGMLLLTALLEAGIVPVELLRPSAEFLVRHLALLYVPAGVALMVYAGVVLFLRALRLQPTHAVAHYSRASMAKKYIACLEQVVHHEAGETVLEK